MKKRTDDEVPIRSFSIRLTTIVVGIIIFLAAIGTYHNLKENKDLIKISEENLENTQIAEIKTDNFKRTETVSSRYERIERTEMLPKVDNIEEIIAEEEKKLQYISIDEVKRDDFIELMRICRHDTSGFFYQNAGLIYDLCEKYEINEIFFAGLISAESGWNIASNHRAKHNYISLMSNGGLIAYPSLEEGLEIAARKLHDNYLTEGGSFYYGKTLSAVNTKFCGSSTWVGLVYGRMQQILP